MVHPYFSENMTGCIPVGLARRPTVELSEALNAEILWEQLRGIVGNPEWASDKVGPGDHRERVGFIRQAEAYWRGAEKVEGPGAALLYYYCFLNLAKAELVGSEPAKMAADPMHGLQCRPSLSDDYKTARVGVSHPDGKRVIDNQLFWMLYRKRVGYDWPSSKDVSVLECLRRVPEVSTEIERVGSRPVTMPVYHAVTVIGNSSSRSEMLIRGYSGLAEIDPDLKERIEQVYTPRSEVHENWREIFSISRRFASADMVLLVVNEVTDISAGPGRFDGSLGMRVWRDRMYGSMGANLEDQMTNSTDGLLVPGVPNEGIKSLPSDISRYIVYYYMSTLVRYRPSALLADYHPEQTWLLSAFARQAALPLLHGFCSQMSDKPYVFSDGRF